jgi:HPt (histidine-containing phosphotransfer) domain-containing protein
MNVNTNTNKIQDIAGRDYGELLHIKESEVNKLRHNYDEMLAAAMYQEKRAETAEAKVLHLQHECEEHIEFAKECREDKNKGEQFWRNENSTIREREEVAKVEVERLQKEIDNIKQVEFPNRIEKITELWRKRVASTEAENTTLRNEVVRLCAVCNQRDDDYQKVMKEWSEYIKEQNIKYQSLEEEVKKLKDINTLSGLSRIVQQAQELETELSDLKDDYDLQCQCRDAYRQESDLWKQHTVDALKERDKYLDCLNLVLLNNNALSIHGIVRRLLQEKKPNGSTDKD